ncbi:MAG: efflux RND transporter permease subunit, partial [Planctomycetia bacterium]
MPFEPNLPRVVFEGLFEHGTPGTHEWTLALGGAAAGAVAGVLVWKPFNAVLAVFFAGFNAVFDFGTTVYTAAVSRMLRLAALVLLVYGGLLGLTVWSLSVVPVGFIPEMDKGYFLVNIKLPDSASLERTAAVVEQVRKICAKEEGVSHVIGVAGYSLVAQANSTSNGTLICTLETFDKRTSPERRVNALTQRVRRAAGNVQEAIVAAFGAPPVDGLGRSGGFKSQVQDRGNLGPAALESAAQDLARAANAQPEIVGATSTYTANLPQLFLDVDRAQAKTLG